MEPTPPTKITRVVGIGDAATTVEDYDPVDLQRWKTQHDAWVKNKKRYDNQMDQAAAYIYTSWCTAAMQTKLRGLADYKDKVELDAIEMLKRIQKLVQHSTTKEHPTMQQIARGNAAFNPEQMPNERVDLFIKRVDAGIEQAIAMGALEFIIGDGPRGDDSHDWATMDQDAKIASASVDLCRR